MNNKLIPIVITLVVGIILAGSVLMPVLNDATTIEKTLTNDGVLRMDKITTADSTVITWDHTAPSIITVDDVDITLPDQNAVVYLTVNGTDNDFMVRYTPSATNPMMVVFNGNNANVEASVTNGRDLTVTISEGSISVTDGTNTETATFTDYAFIPSENGKYVMKNPNKVAYLNADSEIYGMGRSFLSASNINLNFTIAADVETEPTVDYYGRNVTATISNAEVNATKLDTYVDMYEFSSITFDVTISDNTSSVTYNQVIVPYQVTSELSQHLTPGQIALMGAIPVLVIVALLVVAVGVVARRND